MAKAKQVELTSLTCWHCDFGSGQRGMDRCGKCKGTGRLFWVNGRAYPYTPEDEKLARATLSDGKDRAE